jgi:hypothetical protein
MRAAFIYFSQAMRKVGDNRKAAYFDVFNPNYMTQ